MTRNTIEHNSLLIIGNGFDKNCGLKTSYSDIYEKYCVEPSSNETIARFKKNIGKDYDKWSDFEEGMAEYAKAFENEDRFIDCLIDFNHFMHEYLTTIQQQFHDDWNSMTGHEYTINEFRGFISSLGLNVTHNTDHMVKLRMNSQNPIYNMSIISFNYTDVFDWIYNCAYKGFVHNMPVHVHGKLGDDPILGMDREEQLDLKFPITNRLKRSFLKPCFNNEYDSYRIELAEALLNRADMVFVYGASLGESDLIWRERLIEWLNSNKNNHLFIYDYNNANKELRVVFEKLQYEENKKRELLEKWRISDMDGIVDRIHLPCGFIILDLETALCSDSSKKAVPLA